MTPLAARIVNELTLKKSQRTFDDRHDLLARMSDIHCFEISRIFDLVKDAGEKLYYRTTAKNGRATKPDLDERLAFLPAPRTWIEWGEEGTPIRTGLLLEESPVEKGLVLATVAGCNKDAFGSFAFFLFPLRESTHFLDPKLGFAPLAGISEETAQIHLTCLVYNTYAALALINTPRVIGRRQYMPHRGLEKRLTACLGAGKFPLHAWTEIRLEVSKPPEIDDGEPHEAHLTGRRALHFCRAHLRIRLGMIEFVISHWRGDAALGIKQSRYLVTP